MGVWKVEASRKAVCRNEGAQKYQDSLGFFARPEHTFELPKSTDTARGGASSGYGLSRLDTHRRALRAFQVVANEFVF